MDQTQTTNRVPITVFSGFLGSGKTTIILNLIEQLQKTQQIIYIKNEIGEENIDGTLLKGRHIETKELLNGCICCTLVGPFVSAINEVIETFRPDRVIIEASGVADPSAIALMIDAHEKLVRDGIISIIDVVNFEGYKDISLTAQNQTKFTDLIVFNKVELADLNQKRAVVGYVRELNTHAPIIEAPHGVLSPAVVFGVANSELLTQLHHEAVNADGQLHDHVHHLEADGLDTLAFPVTRSIQRDELSRFFDQIDVLPPSVFRVKAIINTPEGTSLLLNRVGSRTTIETLQESVRTTKLVVIGFHLKNEATTIHTALKPILGSKESAT